MLTLNQIVRWKDCPGSIWMFEVSRIRGVSPCNQFALLSWIRHPVRMDSLIPTEDPKNFWAAYAPTANQWGEDGKDKSTGQDLTRWTHASN